MIARVATTLTLTALVAAMPSAWTPAPYADDDPEVLARELLERAEEKARKGSYSRALTDYKKVFVELGRATGRIPRTVSTGPAVPSLFVVVHSPRQLSGNAAAGAGSIVLRTHNFISPGVVRQPGNHCRAKEICTAGQRLQVRTCPPLPTHQGS